jgi:hypothetical protein
MFDGEIAAGPVLIFFAEDPEEAREAMMEDMGKAHLDIMRVNKNFFTPEVIEPKDAHAMLKKPR